LIGQRITKSIKQNRKKGRIALPDLAQSSLPAGRIQVDTADQQHQPRPLISSSVEEHEAAIAAQYLMKKCSDLASFVDHMEQQQCAVQQHGLLKKTAKTTSH
jgi:hypothetical protein